MATSKRPSYTQLMSPLGTFVYPKLNAPDTKYKADGEYGVKLRLPVDESEKLIAFYEAELAKYWPIALAEAEQKVADAKPGPAKAKAKVALAELKEADKPYKPAYDDEGNETGEYEFNFKMPASYMKDKGKPTEKKASIRPDVFDASGKKLAVIPEIWGGTTGYVAGELRPFSMPIGVGLSLRLKGVQIIELQSGSGGRDAAAYGFGKHEGGYSAADDETPAASSEEGSGAGEEADEEF